MYGLSYVCLFEAFYRGRRQCGLAARRDRVALGSGAVGAPSPAQRARRAAAVARRGARRRRRRADRHLPLRAQGSATTRLRFLSTITLKACREEGAEDRHGEDHRHRPRHDQLLYGRARGRRAHRHPERRGRAHDTVRRRLREGRPAARRGAREAPAGDEPAEHDLLDQALHGAQVGRGLGRDDDRPLRGRQGRERRRARRGGGQGVRAAGDQRDDPAEAEGGRRVVPRRDGHGRRGHRPGLLQQRAARGDEGRRPHRRPQRRCASSTSRPRRRSPTGSTRRAPTRRSSSSTSAAARSTCRCSRSPRACSR